MKLKISDLIDPKQYRKMRGDVHDNWERYILSVFKDQFKITEGLILTHPISKAVDVLDRTGYVVVEPRNVNVFHVIVTDADDVDKLMKIAKNLGWFPSAISDDITINFNKYTESNLRSLLNKSDKVFIRFEAKYDIQLDRSKFDYLYHFTKKAFLEKIKRNGLTPKTASKLSNHPERVYLSYTQSGAEKFGKKFVNRIYKYDSNHSDELKAMYSTGMILRIRVENIPDYFKIYEDPNYKSSGCFTLNNIPWKYIDVIKEFNLE